MKKRGITLVEIIVATGIFMILISLAVGAFITFSNAKSLSVKMRNSQEKVRVALDMMTKLSQQASEVRIVSVNNEQRLVLTNEATGEGGSSTAAQFIIGAPDATSGLSELYYLECSSSCGGFESVSASTGQKLLGGELKLSSASGFSRKLVNNLPYLDIKLNGSTGSQTKVYYSDSFSVETGVIIRESY